MADLEAGASTTAMQLPMVGASSTQTPCRLTAQEATMQTSHHHSITSLLLPPTGAIHHTRPILVSTLSHNTSSTKMITTFLTTSSMVSNRKIWAIAANRRNSATLVDLELPPQCRSSFPRESVALASTQAASSIAVMGRMI